MTFGRSTGPTVRTLAGFVVAVLVLVLAGAPVSAHTDLEASDPVDGSVVTEPVTSVAFAFGAAVEPVDDELGLFDAEGEPIEVASVSVEESGTVIRLTPVEPLEDGVFGARWAIRGTDGHSVVGSITFTVERVSATTAPSGRELSTETTQMTETTDRSESGETADGRDAVSDELAASLAPASSTTSADRLANVARFAMYLGMLVAVGGLAFLRWVHDGTASEARRLRGLVRTGALLALVGAMAGLALEAVGVGGGGPGALFDGSAWAELADRGLAAASVLRLIGAVAILVGLSADERLDRLAVLGAVALLVSGVFVGHTASESPRLLVALADMAHMAAGGVWTGGVLALLVTLRLRRRSERAVGPLATRFSVVAGYCVGLAGITGVALAWAILPDLDALTTSSFGRLLLLKVTVALVALAVGAYNHFVVVPAIEAGHAEHRRSDADAARLRTTATVEVVLLVVIVAVTAVLVASAAT